MAQTTADVSAADNGEVATDLQSLHDGYDAILRVSSAARPPFLRSLVILLQRIRRRLLAPILLPQVAHNAATTRLLSHVLTRLQLPRARDPNPETLRQLDAIVAEGQQRQTSLDELRMRVRSQEARILQLEALTRTLSASTAAQPGPTATSSSQTEGYLDDALYAALEEAVRGPRQQVKDACGEYLAILTAADLGGVEMPVLDLGSGRGEWLELLHENGLTALGVERNRVFVEAYRTRGMPVVKADVLAYLRNAPAASVGVVTGFHILEHLRFEDIIATLDQTVRVLKAGGVAIFETPDPDNVQVSGHFFYVDPTHQRPLPSTTLKLLAAARGLRRIEIRRLHPFPDTLKVQDEHLEVTRRFNAHFYGPQDYALIGWKLAE